ncbi:MAG TPA: hypothetical protein VM597_37615, partial [Gemmataceae bacterium]|nr:hypothetical protein [Gemmataceae bacterium]
MRPDPTEAFGQPATDHGRRPTPAPPLTSLDPLTVPEETNWLTAGFFPTLAPAAGAITPPLNPGATAAGSG